MFYDNIQLVVLPKQAAKEDLLRAEVAKKIGVRPDRVRQVRIIRKSIDARSKVQVKVNLTVQAFTDKTVAKPIEYPFKYGDVRNCEKIVIVGAGPAGLFAALRLIELGYCPVVLERGKAVSDRKVDVAQLCRNNGLNEESNYCFGEGGAGTFSDGKLFTRSKKKGDSERILQVFHYHGAQDSILYEAHPHIGTDRLPEVIKKMRKTILDCGGEIHFETKVSHLIIENDTIKGVVVSDGTEYKSRAVVLATGHSARDIYQMLHDEGVALEAKGFAMGVRVEHKQALIDKIQYHAADRGLYLPAAEYSFVTQVDGRGVYTFCMCPGGFVVPASTYKGETVVNGMSSSGRNSPYANSAVVVEIRVEDLPELMPDYEQYGVLAGLEFQKRYEQMAYANSGGGNKAPCQRLYDFVKGRMSFELPDVSYLPGVTSSPIHFWMPDFISKRLREGFVEFDKKRKGFLTNDAVIIGVESRTSSPVRIPRDMETMQHVQIKGLYPAGEGAGYAGGITSSAVDGDNVAVKISEWLKSC